MGDWRPRMRKAVEHVAEQLRAIRAGSVSAGLLSSVRVTAGGNSRPLNKAATIKPQGDRFLITPFSAEDVPGIVRSLVEAKLAAYALNPTTVCVTVPPISGEQRLELVKHVKRLGEEAKVAVRAVRQEARKYIDTTGRGSFKVVQEHTDLAVEEIERLVSAKIKEVAE